MGKIRPKLQVAASLSSSPTTIKQQGRYPPILPWLIPLSPIVAKRPKAEPGSDWRLKPNGRREFLRQGVTEGERCAGTSIFTEYGVQGPCHRTNERSVKILNPKTVCTELTVLTEKTKCGISPFASPFLSHALRSGHLTIGKGGLIILLSNVPGHSFKSGTKHSYACLR
ncbi:dTDP-glucose 4,6-dehydratase [Striga asiatica]|uniref:dTDP-glucose 4,6-dehydratase n=1 Tax=Striga asiatica TaxID=4170 RepID=A0A5A7PZ05_STRAF|nr:dTDP-glucose 4,6-dehydratase [Striga asiatica]